jgi:ABC-2 type transport system permease protein
VDSASGVRYEYDDTREDARNARLVADDAIQRGAGRMDPVPLAEAFVRERGSRYIDFVIPGLLGMGLMGNGIWAIGFGIVDARRRKLLKRYMATPMSRSEYLASFIISRFALLVVEVLLLVGFSALVFDVPVRGSLALLAVICVLGALSFCALGLLLAARPRTIEAANGLMNLAMLPMWILSGVFFSAENFPNAFQPFIQALPLTAVNDALRASMLRGDGWSVVAPELAILLAWGVVSFIVALKIFRWR